MAGTCTHVLSCCVLTTSEVCQVLSAAILCPEHWCTRTTGARLLATLPSTGGALSGMPTAGTARARATTCLVAASNKSQIVTTWQAGPGYASDVLAIVSDYPSLYKSPTGSAYKGHVDQATVIRQATTTQDTHHNSHSVGGLSCTKH